MKSEKFYYFCCAQLQEFCIDFDAQYINERYKN